MAKKKGLSKYIWKVCRWEDDWMMLKPIMESTNGGSIVWAAETMRKLRKHLTNAEVCVARYLVEKNVYFISQAPFRIKGHLYFADFYFPSIKTILEVDGSSHDSMEQKQSDKKRDELFASVGIRTIWITNYTVYRGWFKDIVPTPEREEKTTGKIVYLKEGESAFANRKIKEKLKIILKYLPEK